MIVALALTAVLVSFQAVVQVLDNLDIDKLNYRVGLSLVSEIFSSKLVSFRLYSHLTALSLM